MDYSIFLWLTPSCKRSRSRSFELLFIYLAYVADTKLNSAVLLFAFLYKVVLTHEFVDEILYCENSNESDWAVLSCCSVYYAAQGGCNFWICGWNPMVCPFKLKRLSSTSLWCCLFCCTRWFLVFWVSICNSGLTN